MIGANSIGASPIGADAGAVEIAPTTIVANLVGPVQTVTSFAQNIRQAANAALICPSPALDSQTIETGSANLTAPVGALTSFGGGNAALEGPAPTILSTGRDSTGDNAAALSAPASTLAAFGGATAQLTVPTQQLAAEATVTALGRAALSAPAPTLSARSTVSATVAAALSAPMATVIGYSGAVCSVSVTGRATLMASGTTGTVGAAALSCPLFELTAGATRQASASAELIAPSPRMGVSAQAWLVAPSARLTAIGSAVVTATYEAYAVNLKHTQDDGAQTIDEVTRYTNFPFTHVVRYRNSYYGANATGLYLLEGTTDDGSPIPWAVTTGMMDFGTPKLKTVAVAYFGGRFGRASTITLSAGEAAPVSYSFSTPRSALAKNHRQVFGRGVKARYHALSAAGEHEFELDDVTLDIHNTTRRV